MSRFASAPTIGNRLFRAGLTALYAAIALLGSGGLHAIAPQGLAACCLPRADEASHTLGGCSHRHTHSHADCDHSQTPAPAEPCHDKGCAICEIMATPATPVAIVVLPPLVEAAEAIAPAVECPVAVDATSPFWIRGPPVVG